MESDVLIPLRFNSSKIEINFIEGHQYFFEITLGIFGIVIEQKINNEK